MDTGVQSKRYGGVSKELLGQALDRVDEAIFVVGEQRRFVQCCNAAVKEVFGYEPRELVGKSTELLHVDHERFARFGELCGPALDAEGRFETEYRMRRKDGTLLHTHNLVAVLDRDKGRKGGVVSVVRDITDRVQTDAALRKFRERVNRGPAMVFETAVGGEWPITFVSDNVCQLGYRPEDFTSGQLAWVDIAHSEDVKRVKQEVSSLHSGGVDKVTIELRVFIKEGEEVRWLQAQCYALDGVDGKPAAIEGIAVDITERKRTEILLEQKNAALRELVEQVSTEKAKVKEAVAANLDEVVMPLLSKLRREGSSGSYLDLLEHHLREITSGYSREIVRNPNSGLTQREREICDMIKGGLTSKEIAQTLGLSVQTIQRHRRNIRKRLQLTGKGQSLSSFLAGS
mgnify:CR=1 FL=1